MEIKYHKHKERKMKRIELMIRVATDYNSGMSALDLARRYGVTRAYIYKLLKLAQKPITNLETK
jgi:DNA-binding transcriptional regulator LsrR (DeoR family)